MADAILQVLSVEDPRWSSSQHVENGLQLKNISYKITLNGRRFVRVVFPVYSPGDYTSIPRDKALLTIADWEQISIGLEQEGVSANRKGLPLGVYDLHIADEQLKEITFQLELQQELAPYEGTANASCKLQYAKNEGGRTKWVDLPDPATIVIVKNVLQPVVIKFTAKHIIVASDESTVLEWEVINSSAITINDGKKQLNIPENLFKGEFKTDSLSLDTDFTLTASNGSGSPVSYILPVKVNKNSAFVPEKQYLFEGQKLMGLYQWKEKLYALVLYERGMNESDVLFWESFDGLNWQKTNVYSKAPCFKSSRMDTSRIGASAEIPVDFAGSPGVVFNNKLYLIGGSRFDVNSRNNRVYYFDFDLPEDGWQRDIDAGFTQRMGHACLLHEEKIWVIGGYDDQGTSNEVWTFDGVKWSNVSQTYALKNNRCMLSAIVNNNGNIEIYGGFGEFPGKPDQTLASAYVLQQGSWRSIQLSEDAETLNYVSCTAVKTRGQTFILNTIYDRKLSDRIQLLVRNKTVMLKDILNPTDFGVEEFIYNIQAVDFKDVVWVCILNKMDTVKSNLLSYFVYVPLNQFI